MGTLFCLASGAAFGAMAVFGKLSYGEGATVGTLLAVRFTFAAALFWAAGAGVRVWRGGGGSPRPAPPPPPPPPRPLLRPRPPGRGAAPPARRFSPPRRR